jgi:transposase-like protein
MIGSTRGSSAPVGYRFPREVIAVAVRWYLRYGLSYRDVEELLAERGIEVDHVTVYRWVQTFTPAFIDAARPARHTTRNRWFVDETYVKVAGRWTYLYRAVNQHGQVIDVVLCTRRDVAAARTFFARALRLGLAPVEVTTDRAPVYPRVLDEMTPAARHVTEQYANNAIEADHGRLKARLRPMRDSNAWPRCAPSRPGTPSCRTCGAATTRSPPTCRSVIGCASPSTSLRYPSNRSQVPATPEADTLLPQQRNSAAPPMRSKSRPCPIQPC